MNIVFNVHGNKKQLEASKYWIDKTTTEIVYGGGKNGGKSYLGVSLIFGDAFLYPGIRCFIARKTLNDLIKHTIPSIYEVFGHWGITEDMYRFDGKNNIWKLANGSEVLFLDAKLIPSDPKYARFGSMQMTRGWIEEAGEFNVDCKKALYISLGRWKNEKYGLTKKLLQTCNPAKNYLYTYFYKPWKSGELKENLKFIQALSGENKKAPEGYLEDLIDQLSYEESQRLVFGNWETDDNDLVLFEYSKIIDLFTNEYVKKTGKKYLTADIAYEGSDLFVIGVWNGFVLEKVIAIDKISDVLVSAKIHEIRLRYGVPISSVIYDADGLKKFVRNSVKNGNLKGATPFNNNKRAYGKENYGNLKTQCFFKLSEMVNKGEIYVSDFDYREKIVEELEQIRKQPVKEGGKILLEKKEDLKLRLKRSPDFADMMMMRMVTEVRTIQDIVVKWS